MTDVERQPVPTHAPPTFPPAGWVRAEPGGAPVATEPPAGAADLPAATALPAPRTALVAELVVVTVAFALPGIVFGLRGITDPEQVSTDIGVLELLASVVSTLGAASVGAYLLWRDGLLRRAGFDRPRAASVLGHGFLGVGAIVVALFAVLVLWAGIAGTPADDDSAADGDPPVELTLPSLAAGALIALSAGVGEEILYRAYAITRLEQLGLRRAALVLPWAVFTVGHLYQGPIALLVIGTVAAVLTWLYAWRRSVWPVMLAHALYDMLALALSALVTS